MKPTYIIRQALIGSAAMLLAQACTYSPYDTDIEPTPETMTLTCATPDVAIDTDNLTAPLLTFTWTGARPLDDDYMSMYTAELDVLGNSFGSKTVITSGVGFDYHYDEETGVYTASFTNEQLNNWYNERWALPVNKTFTVEFRVIAQWSGGPEFQTPEVRKVSATVKPVQVIIFNCDEMALDGNAVPATETISPTLENTSVYAWKGTLTPGELVIPVLFDGVTYYLHNTDGTTDVADGTPMPLLMNETRGGWTIPAEGEYRVVINMIDRTATIYSEATDLQPLEVTFRPNGVDTNPEVTLTVADLYAYGGGTGWGAKKLNLIQSLADPQIFIFDGSTNDLKTLSGDMKFCITNSFTDSNGTSYNQNNSYCFTCVLTDEGKRQNLSAELNKLFELHGGADGETRNSYMKVPAGSNFIVFDLRHNTFLATTK